MGYAPVSNTRDNPPCNTLFIGNLGDNVNEQELQGLFAGQQVGIAYTTSQQAAWFCLLCDCAAESC